MVQFEGIVLWKVNIVCILHTGLIGIDHHALDDSVLEQKVTGRLGSFLREVCSLTQMPLEFLS